MNIKDFDEIVSQVKYHAERMAEHIYCIEKEDLIQEGIVAALEAMGRFDKAKGAKIGTFLQNRIRGAMVEYVRSNMPFYEKKKWTQSRKHKVGDVSIEEIVSDNFMHGKYLSKDGMEQRYIDKDIVSKTTKILNHTERETIFRIYYEGFKQKEVAEMLGINESAVSQSHKKALLKIKGQMNNE